MLKKLRLQNFRCFDDHTLSLRPTTIIVGRNNVGKSTIVEALRLISLVVSRYTGLNFSFVPPWLTDLPRYTKGVMPSVTGTQINFATIFHRYSDPPAIITATFDTGDTVSIFIGPEGKVFASIKDRAGTVISSKSQARQALLPTVNILPQVAPLIRQENILRSDYVSSSVSSYLAPLHFRNQIRLMDEYFERFKDMAERSWPTLEIRDLDISADMELILNIRDGDFVGEVGLMGHGLQMWLQTMWFLARSESESTVILDEPDVYMHPDLQRRLLRLLRGAYKQVIIATHSVEIMSEVDPDQILVIDRQRRQSMFADSLPAVQQIIEHIGGVHNIQLARLWNSRRCIFIEGEDISILKRIQNTLFPNTHYPLGNVPNIPITGRGGWNYVVGSSLLLKNAGGEEIIPYCILDRDYHTPEEIDEKLADAMQRGIQLHIWQRKEIENYLLIPEAIQRLISQRIAGYTPPNTTDIICEMDRIADNSKIDVVDAIASQLHNKNKGWDVSTANQEARRIVDSAWANREGRFAIISGKQMLSKLSGWSKQKFGVSFTIGRLAEELRQDEISDELIEVLRAIEEGEPFG